MKKILNIVLIIVMLLGMMFIIVGCGRTKFSVDDCLKYMNEKYGEEFTYIELKDQTSQTMKIYVKSERYPHSKILVIEEITSEGKAFHDNYIGIKYENEVRELTKQLANEVYGDSRIIYEVQDIFYLDDNFNANTTFSDYISRYSSSISVNILLPPQYSEENKETKLNELYKKFCDNKFVCTFNVYYVNNQNAYENLQTSSEMMLSKDWFTANGQIVIDENYKINNQTWR